VAGNPQTSGELLRRLATDADEDVRTAVARNGQTPPELLSTLAADASRQVRRSATIVQRLLVQIEGPWCEQGWRESLRTLLLTMDQHENKMGDAFPQWQLFWMARRHPDLPDPVRQTILAICAASWDATKIHAVFVTDAPGVAATFPARREPYRYILASSMPPIALHKLAVSPYWDIRFLVALHSQTPGKPDSV